MAAASQKAKRYVIKQVLGKGGMGVVYRAYDNETRRDITLKTIIDLDDPNLLELFRKECQVLASINHPNIVDIYDVGEMEMEDRIKRPYFVMPLLPGVTLNTLIENASHRLSTDRVIDIIAQTCRGLHAAHDRGLVHRDVKPNNIFVLDDDSVKIIDFGVAHLTGSRTVTSLKGTLSYMAPEQVQMQKPTPVSDLFSLAVVSYEALTRRRPFDGATMDETIQAIMQRNPPPACDLNPSVTRIVSQVVHKGMAKQPWNRFSSVKEFGDQLQRAFRGEQLPMFDESRIFTRVQKAQRALEAGEYEFANEVLSGLEAESWIHSEMPTLRRSLDQAVRSRNVRQLLDSARRYFQEEEFQLALQKIQEVARIDPDNSEALALRAEVESTRAGQQVNQWLNLAHQHIENHSYHHARQAVQNVLQLKPGDTIARRLLSDIDHREQEYMKLRAKKQELYQSAMDAFSKGDLSTAVVEMERVLELDRRAPETSASDRTSMFQKSYQQVLSERDALNEAYGHARQHLTDKNFKAALAICEEYLGRYPGHALFQALRVDVEDRERQELSAYIARMDREVDAEPDLDRRVSMLQHALEEYPGEPHFKRVLQLVTARRDLVASLVGRARSYEERGQFTEAIGQWETLRNIHPAYPGLDFEIERTAARRDQQVREEARRSWLARIDAAAADGEWNRALELSQHALAEFPEDSDIETRAQFAGEALERAGQAKQLLTRASACTDPEETVDVLNRAAELDPRNSAVRAALLDLLVKQARALLDTDRDRAAGILNQALRIEPGNPLARSLLKLIEDRQARDDEERNRALDEAKEMGKNAETISDPAQLETMLQQTVSLADRYSGDRDFESIVAFLRQRVEAASKPPEAPPPAESQSQAAAAPRRAKAPKPAQRPPAAPKRKQGPPKILYAAAGAVLVIGAGMAWHLTRPAAAPAPVVQTPPQPTPVTPPVVVIPPEPDPKPQADTPVVKGGTLIVRANESDFTVLIDGRRRQYRSRRDAFVIPDVPAGKRKIEIQRSGYEVEPAVQIVDVAAGANVEIAVTLSPKPASLVLQNAMSGTQVMLAGRRLGTVDAGGRLTVTGIPPGDHTIELRLRGYRTRTIPMRLNPGDARDIFPDEAQLEQMMGTLELKQEEPKRDVTLSVAPTPGVIDFRGPKELAQIPPRLDLPVGKYNLTFSARGYQTDTFSIELVDGEVKHVPIKLRRR